MKVIAVIAAKGGVGKSSVAISLAAALGQKGKKILLIDSDPRAQLTEWLDVGDGFTWEGTLVSALLEKESITDVIQPTDIKGVSIIAGAALLHECEDKMKQLSDYHSMYAAHLDLLPKELFDFVILDCPDGVNTLMQNSIFAAQVIVVPFDSTKAVKTYPNLYSLIHKMRPKKDYKLLHLLYKIPLPGLRKDIVKIMQDNGLSIAKTEIRSCGWLAKVDEHGGSIFDYRPESNGAKDIMAFTDELLKTIRKS